MFSITSARYFLYREATDIRKGFDSLSGMVSGQLGQNPMSGDVFIFINRQRNRIKLLRWEPGGFVLFYKRLEKGTFELPDSQKADKKQILNYGELAMLITGISMRNAKKRKRFLQQNIVGKMF
jgi:transposase